MHRLLIAGAVGLLLAGCSSFSVPPSTGPASLRALDYASDDLAGVVIAFDLPEGVQPLIGGTALSVEATSAAGARRVRAVLEPADFGDVVDALPPPSAGQTYYVFGFSEPDRAAIREAQTWARSQSPGTVGVKLEPKFCTTAGGFDPSRAQLTVLVALPGARGLAPLVASQPLAQALADSGQGTLPVCARG